LRGPLTPVVSGPLLLSAQALTASRGASPISGDSLAFLSPVDCNTPRLPDFGASVGASGEGHQSSVPVALTTIAADSGPPDSGSPGSDSTAPATSKSFGSV